MIHEKRCLEWCNMNNIPNEFLELECPLCHAKLDGSHLKTTVFNYTTRSAIEDMFKLPVGEIRVYGEIPCIGCGNLIIVDETRQLPFEERVTQKIDS